MSERTATLAAGRPADERAGQWTTIDGNEAATHVAYRLSEVVAIYPITPASPMGELADAWASQGRPNLWGTVPRVVEMQSEGGAAGAVHGSLQAGALTTTFTASQGLLLMLPNMYKIAGELSPMVMHVAARTVATHALSIFGDHSDVMGARQTGFAMLASGSVQEAHDLAAIAHAATLRAQLPMIHFFDGFRTSHEVAKIQAIPDDVLSELVSPEDVDAHRFRALNPDHPAVRGTAQNPDVFFQAREACNPFYDALPPIVSDTMQRFGDLTGRRYQLFDYYGHPGAQRVLVMMGSGTGAACEAVDRLNAAGEQVGLLTVRLYRPFDTSSFVAQLPEETTSLVVLDRTKEPGAIGEPLYQDVVTALAEEGRSIRVVGGRYGLSSKEFTPEMAARCLAEAQADSPKNHFTVGITDDVTRLSLEVTERWTEPSGVMRAVFYGLGSDGTVGANKHTVKIVGTETDLFAQGYFVYDSKKAGSRTVSHLRFRPAPITSTYLIRDAQFVGVHWFDFLEKSDVLEVADTGATVLINSPFGVDGTWDALPVEAQRQIIEKELEVHVVDASAVARTAGLGGRVNTVLQTCFFALTDLLPTEQAIGAIKASIKEAYGARGEVVLRRNFDAVDAALAGLARLPIPADITAAVGLPPPVPAAAPDFVQRVTAMMLAGHGDLLPVSALPVDGTFPTATAQWEKRSIGDEIPIWDPEICIDCGRCALVCPHAAIRMKVYEPEFFNGAPELKSKEWTGRDAPGALMTIQVAPDDCTGCGVCVAICPAKSKEVVKHRAINMEPKLDHLEVEQAAWSAFLEIPERDRTLVQTDNVRGSQILQPLFEFSGACAGCGETPYIKLMTQMFGDRAIIANATGCSSIYGGNLPTTPYAINTEGRGPAWSNSLFEDNAEFGLGMRLALDQKRRHALALLDELAPNLGGLAAELRDADQGGEAGIAAQRERVERLKSQLTAIRFPAARRLEALADSLVDTSVWIIGGDGWAYDIGFGGLDHVLATGENVNILVLDTEVYSNTGGQASKATPRAAVAKFASGGKPTGKKDLGMIAMAYGNVYVAHVSMGANMTQMVKAFAEAEAHPGPALIIAYSPCIAHGIDLSDMASHQKDAVESGYWPLYRYDPMLEAAGKTAFRLDSRPPTKTFEQFARTEARFAMLARANPEHAAQLMAQAQQDIDDRWHLYEQMEDIEWTVHPEEAEVT